MKMKIELENIEKTKQHIDTIKKVIDNSLRLDALNMHDVMNLIDIKYILIGIKQEYEKTNKT